MTSYPFTPFTFTGTAGNDTIAGTNSADIILGLAGNDSLSGFDGADSIDGGDGNDTILGGLGADTLIGGKGDDLIYGGAGDDVIFAGSGNDTICGGYGNDRLQAGGGNDHLYGELGNDLLIGHHGPSIDGREIDRLYGGAGADTFAITNGYAKGGGNDYAIVGDFRVSEGDRLQFTRGTHYSTKVIGVSTWIYSGTDVVALINGVNLGAGAITTQSWAEFV